MLNKQQFITDILKSDESLQNFIAFWGRQYKYAFYSVLELYANNPKGTFFAETSQWNQAGRYINADTKSIYLHYPDGKHKCVFDLSQTHGKEIPIWSLPLENREQAFSFIEGNAATNLGDDYAQRLVSLAQSRYTITSFLNRLTLQGSGSYTFDLSDTQFGKILLIENIVSSLPGNVEKTKNSILSAKKRLTDINNELALPFEHTDELNKIIRRKTELDSQLNLDKVTDDGIGMEEEPGKPLKIAL